MKDKKLLKNGITSSFYILFFTLLTLLSCNRQVALTNNASLQFNMTSYDFGKLPLKKPARIVFSFENNGKELLQIKDVTTSCGCTISKWTTNALKPSQKGTITVIYDAEYPGRFMKTITVFYNGKNSPQELKIKGQIEYPKENG